MNNLLTNMDLRTDLSARLTKSTVTIILGVEKVRCLKLINLTADQIKLAEQLLITVMKREPHVEYKELGDRVTPQIHYRQVPHNIGAISRLCFELKLPFISAKVVSKSTKVAGEGFYPFYIEYFPGSKNLTPREVFKEECKKIRECNEWYKLADYLHIVIDLPRPSEKDVHLAIRILPMSSKNEFPGMSIEDIQNKFFLGELINEQQGIYKYRNSGLNTPDGSLILFQFDNFIIASAELLGVEKYKVPVDSHYFGALKFDINSVKVFLPITCAEINMIDSNITRFSQVKQDINSLYWNKINTLMILLRKPPKFSA